MNNIIEGLNKEQIDAVLTESKRVLILAGAGSGKTKTITSRIIHLLKNESVPPEKILALTFTNKAAGEMKSRIESITGEVPGLLIKTFHSFGAYFLRRTAEAVGRKQNFIIYDEDDSKKIIDKVLSGFQINKSDYNKYRKWVKNFKQKIEKDVLEDDTQFIEVYKSYNEQLKLNNAFDFEDLILQPVKILMEKGSIYTYYRKKLQYILVDEYQDTNYTQYSLLKELTDDNSNLMVVGDEDQSIYKFRGADVNIILNFPKDYANTHIIKLEKNYRSTSNILNLANTVISHNINRLGKNLYAENGEGENVKVLENEDDYSEAQAVAHIIRRDEMAYVDTAILVRTNNQTRVFEQVFMKSGIPFKIVAGVGFYDREEIKDCLSILRWLSNNSDSVAFERFANKPSRGIGKKSLDIFLSAVAHSFDGDIMKALCLIETISGITGKALAGFKELRNVLLEKDDIVSFKYLSDSLEWFLDALRISEYFKNIDDSDGSDRIGNIRELMMTLENVDPGVESITAYLEDNALVSQTDQLDNSDAIKILTVHNAKGLEFSNVFICGVERDIFPHCNSVIEDEDGIEEERRLFYVAITRAKHLLYIMYANSRSIYGVRKSTGKSLFLTQIPSDLIELIKIKKNDSMDFENCIFQVGEIVRSKDYGSGRVLSLRKSGKYDLALIDFFDYSQVEVIVQFAKLEKIDD